MLSQDCVLTGQKEKSGNISYAMLRLLLALLASKYTRLSWWVFSPDLEAETFQYILKKNLAVKFKSVKRWTLYRVDLARLKYLLNSMRLAKSRMWSFGQKGHLSGAIMSCTDYYRVKHCTCHGGDDCACWCYGQPLVWLNYSSFVIQLSWPESGPNTDDKPFFSKARLWKTSQCEHSWGWGVNNWP